MQHIFQYERHMNLDRSKGEIVQGIPCGVGDADYGFMVIGTGKQDLNRSDFYPTLFALVYNFLIRDTCIQRENYPQYMKTQFFNHELDYGRVYRFMMILIDLLETEGETKLYLNVIGDMDEFRAAVDILNEYLGVFGRLIKTNPSWITVVHDKNGKSISAETQADYCVENHTKDCGLKRRIRYGNRVNYKLDISDKEDLEFLLKEISPFKTFKRGQFEALCSMMNSNGHAVCIMPTGSGKSLIYYMACLLQPQVIFVVSPTDILIKDQIRNLRKIHHFDNVTYLDLNSDNDFAFFRPATNLIFLTPATFQNRNLFSAFKKWKKEIAYVVLDEIHCLSNWGHDFRPEYLMLSKNMSQHLGDARYLGFTATANYTVAQDIQKQLNIPFENFFSPILFEKYNIRYDFREADSTEEMLLQVKEIGKEIVRRNGRAIVFTKNDTISQRVADAIGYEADVFTAEDTEAYMQFAEGLCRILVTSEELGIGINLPNVNCTVHFGMPVSKNEYVQEIGRAGRMGEKTTSYVLYLKPTEGNISKQLLSRETSISDEFQLLENMENDYADVYRKLCCNTDSREVLSVQLRHIFEEFQKKKQTAYIVAKPIEYMEQYKRLLYMLYVTGYVKDWYTNRVVDEGRQIEVIVDICSILRAGHEVAVLDDADMLDRMIHISRDYFASMGNDRESVFFVSRAESIPDILDIYVKWYYDKFLYHHKEQFLDVFEFFGNNRECDAVKITEEIEDYFTLPFIQIKEDEAFYGNLSFEEAAEQVQNGIGKNTLSNLERINSDNYSYKLDFLLFVGNWGRWGHFDVMRLERFWDTLKEDEKNVFWGALKEVFPRCTLDAKWRCLKYIEEHQDYLGIEWKEFLEEIYQNGPRDTLYYGILSVISNEKFSEFMRRK